MKSAKFLAFSDLRGRGIPLGNRQLARLEAAGKFPRRVYFSERRVGWLAEEIDAYMAAKIANRCARIGSTVEVAA
jgi:prophage regulatory protein